MVPREITVLAVPSVIALLNLKVVIPLTFVKLTSKEESINVPPLRYPSLNSKISEPVSPLMVSSKVRTADERAMVSAPLPALSLTLPVPVTLIVSSSAPALMVSLPPPEVIVSLPAPEVMSEAPVPSVIVSTPAPELILYLRRWLW